MKPSFSTHVDVAGHANSRTPCRVLFLRSHSKICAYSFIANGLRNSSKIEFAQYPPFPSNYQAKLKKLPQSEEAWQDLNTNFIANYQELSEKLFNGYFDLVLLADHNAQLTEYQRMGRFQRLWTLARLIRSYRANALTQYKYISMFPLSIADICRAAPVIMVDFSDYPYLTPTDVEILRNCLLYFKREVPYNRFVLYHQHFQFNYLRRAQKDEMLSELLQKVHNIPLGIPDDKFHTLTKLRVDIQDIDVFWVGRVSNTMRATTIKLLNEFASKMSWNIVIPNKRLSFQEYCQMIARSKITISVEGGGWDCDRHYEAIALGSLPLINKPTVDAVWWHDMPEEIYFENNFSNFASRIEQLLTADTLRQQCLHEMERVIQKHMLWSKIVEYMTEKAMETISRRC
jgi:hypothetical protein